jgi:hypothetical protein
MPAEIELISPALPNRAGDRLFKLDRFERELAGIQPSEQLAVLYVDTNSKTSTIRWGTGLAMNY